MEQSLKYKRWKELLVFSTSICLDRKEYKYLQNVLQNKLEEYVTEGIVEVMNHGRPYTIRDVIGIHEGKVHGLGLPGMHIHNLHPDIGKLTSLTYLDISKNEITAIPKEFINLTNLAYFDARGNNLDSNSIILINILEKIKHSTQSRYTFLYDRSYRKDVI